MPGFSGSAMVRVVMLPSPMPSTTDLVMGLIVVMVKFDPIQCLLEKCSLLGLGFASSQWEGLLALDSMLSQRNLQKLSRNIVKIFMLIPTTIASTALLYYSS